MSTQKYNPPEEWWLRLTNHVLDTISTEPVEDQCAPLYSSVQVITKQWNEAQCSLSDLKRHLEFLWWSYFTMGMSKFSALDHQRLVHLLACVKQLGYLSADGTDSLPGDRGQQDRL
jgi:hypothetical protein